MNLSFPAYEYWLFFFAGSAAVILAANLFQWVAHRDRIYLLYSLYIFLWIDTFGVDLLSPPANVLAFSRTVPFNLFSLIYLELALTFMDLSSRPRLRRWYRIMQWTWLLMVVPEVYFNLFSSLWQTDWHETQLNLGRTIIVLATNLTILYSFFTHFKRRDVLALFFFVGTLALWGGEILATVSVQFFMHKGLKAEDLTRLPIPIHPSFIMQVGILLDLAFVSLGLSYRQRREGLRQVMAEHERVREREEYLRRQLEADLALQQLKQQHTEARMKALQSQVNPHFLFNALNTLSSLIDENPHQATDYVDELSSVYRYLLRAGDGELTTLSQEMGFIHSYFHLLRIRYGNRVRAELAVGDRYSDALLPPLTLQLLVENAVKHNVALPEQPLTIRIRTTPEGQLVVENNIQRRRVGVESNGVGLSNIADKYRLLNRPGLDGHAPLIEEADGWFRVMLTLLTSEKTVATV